MRPTSNRILSLRKRSGRVDRRRFLAGAAGAMGPAIFGRLPLPLMASQGAPPPAEEWDCGRVRHLLPTVSDSRVLIKVSFDGPLAAPPTLRIGSSGIAGRMNDTAGVFWQFHAAGLRPDRPYSLALTGSDGRSLCEPWTLSTFPAPEARPERFRLLFFTCAGGPGGTYSGIGNRSGFLPAVIRNRLLRRALSLRAGCRRGQRRPHVLGSPHLVGGRRRRTQSQRSGIQFRFFGLSLRRQQRSGAEGGGRSADRTGVRRGLPVDAGVLPAGRPRPLGERRRRRRARQLSHPLVPAPVGPSDPAALLPGVSTRRPAPGGIALVWSWRPR